MKKHKLINMKYGALSPSVLKRAIKYSNQSQAIQMIVWEYILLPKRKRNGVEMADKIIKLFARKEGK